MSKARFVVNALALIVLTLGVSSIANAQATRTWVSGVGDDANPCSRTAPCKTFAGAISKTAAKGEISVLDPGGFGAVTITKSITINGEGTLAGILNANVNGIIVNAPAATDVVYIRNITINGAVLYIKLASTDEPDAISAVASSIDGEVTDVDHIRCCRCIDDDPVDQ